MPILNYHRDDKDLPDMSQPQKCDTCGGVQIGNQMYYSYGKKISVICRSCFLKTRLTKRGPDKGNESENDITF